MHASHIPLVPHHQAYPFPMPAQTPNQDETILDGNGNPTFIGNFHKTLPQDAYGQVVPAAYQAFLAALTAPQGTAPEQMDALPMAVDGVSPAKDSDQLVSPLSGRANERMLPPPSAIAMDPAPSVLGASTGAEMVELYWMALLRDVSFADFNSEPLAGEAISDLRDAFGKALASDPAADPGKLRLITDLPERQGALHLTQSTLFRCGLPGESAGPIVSQFFLKPVRYGAQLIDQRVQPYKAGEDYLTSYADWLDAETRGKDRADRPYQTSRPNLEPLVRPILTMRDLATFVNQDALHQAYFNAALILLAEGYAQDDGMPLPSRRQKGFATWGGPHLLTLVSEVAARALKVVWHQKWQVHRRMRPEVYGGRLEMQQKGPPAMPPRPYGLSPVALESKAVARVLAKTGTHFLPMPFPQGSPTHPSYGAGHATVAGACVTVLKAWFKDDPIKNPVAPVAAGDYAGLPSGTGGTALWTGPVPQLPAYAGGDHMTVWGELNKIACNVALGRSMGGVHWRSDNTRSLRLGEKVAIIFLAREVRDAIERKAMGGGYRDVELSFRSFDGERVRITPEGVFIGAGGTPDANYAGFLN
jgi:hypothetical protein